MLSNMNFINLKDLHLPDDVIENSGDVIPLIGEIHDNEHEIIVIHQLGRRVYTAEVCHVCKKYNNTNIRYVSKVSGFYGVLLLKLPLKEFNGVNYTMACLGEKMYDETINNWLY